MPVPKRKRSRARRDKRFANKGLKIQEFTTCKNCQTSIATHQVCGACGFYKGVKIIVTKAERAIKSGKQRQERAHKKGKLSKSAQAQQTPAQEVVAEEDKSS